MTAAAARSHRHVALAIPVGRAEPTREWSPAAEERCGALGAWGERWPAPVRASVIAALGLASWAGILAGVLTLVR